ncbi:MAG: fructose-bisphosphate aldolase, class [Frankiales bacterium]|jgi:fructose-bisphosphate aldolase class II|nr:fructose-bisphosphate aldolase, class [Frankiales bacterium]
MSLITLRQALDQIALSHGAIGAFNVTELLQAEAVLDAADSTGLPVIVQTLAGSSAHHSDERFWRGLRWMIAEYPRVDVVLHLDHGPDYDTCARAIDAGFSSVMIDASLEPDRRTPAGFETNVTATTKVVTLAHAAGVSVEGELGTIGGGEGHDAAQAIVLADPDQAEEFVRLTGVDALAVAIGTSHGAYKFATEPDGDVLRMDLIEEIASRVPGTHLVMHGSSTLPAATRARINANGGALPESWGVPIAEKIRAGSLGIRKINQGMDSHMAFTAAVRESMAADPQAVDPAFYLASARVEMSALIAARMLDFAGRPANIA